MGVQSALSGKLFSEGGSGQKALLLATQTQEVGEPAHTCTGDQRVFLCNPGRVALQQFWVTQLIQKCSGEFNALKRVILPTIAQ